MDKFERSTLIIGATVYNASPVLLWARQSAVPFRPRPCRCLHSSFIAFLLLTSDSNPGPSCSPNHSKLLVGCLNAGFAVGKIPLLHDLLIHRSIDLLAVTETGFTTDTPRSTCEDLAPSGYYVLNAPRLIQRGGPTRGGGVALVYRDTVDVRPIELPSDQQPTAFEVLVARIVGQSSSHVIVVVYRPPSSSLAVFLDQLADVLAFVGASCSENVVVCGDVNCHGVDPFSIDQRHGDRTRDVQLETTRRPTDALQGRRQLARHSSDRERPGDC